MDRRQMMRANVEHPFRGLKREFGHMKTRCRGLAKNRAQLFKLLVLGNRRSSDDGF